MKNKTIYFVLFLSFLITGDVFAYEVYEGKSTVTPGCEGGILYSITISWFSNTPQDASDDETNVPTHYSHEENDVE